MVPVLKKLPVSNSFHDLHHLLIHPQCSLLCLGILGIRSTDSLQVWICAIILPVAKRTFWPLISCLFPHSRCPHIYLSKNQIIHSPQQQKIHRYNSFQKFMGKYMQIPRRLKARDSTYLVITAPYFFEERHIASVRTDFIFQLLIQVCTDQWQKMFWATEGRNHDWTMQ